MSKELVYDFMRQHKLAVLSYVSGDGTAMSALVGIAVSEGLEIVFDTVGSSRKYQAIIANGNVSLVIGWDAETTVWMTMITGNYIIQFTRMAESVRKTGRGWSTLRFRRNGYGIVILTSRR
jgi:hypothetical protein